MRTAEEILFSKLTFGEDTYLAGEEGGIIAAINEARIEAINECAESATAKMETNIGRGGNYYDYAVVDKQSILSLIPLVK